MNTNSPLFDASPATVGMPLQAPHPTLSATDNPAGKAIAGLVLGIVGLIAWCVPLFGFPINIVGLILSVKGLNSTSRGLAVAGMTTSIVGLALSLLTFVVCGFLAAIGHPLFS